jgi:hypothetical protein
MAYIVIHMAWYAPLLNDESPCNNERMNLAIFAR